MLITKQSSSVLTSKQLQQITKSTAQKVINLLLIFFFSLPIHQFQIHPVYLLFTGYPIQAKQAAQDKKSEIKIVSFANQFQS
jgi:hypothetical protein